MILERLLEERLNSPPRGERGGEREREREREGPEGNEEALLPGGVWGEDENGGGGGERRRRRRRRSKTRGRGERGGSRN